VGGDGNVSEEGPSSFKSEESELRVSDKSKEFVLVELELWLDGKGVDDRGYAQSTNPGRSE